MKKSIGFIEGMLLRKDRVDPKDHKVFDWIKAAKLIKEKSDGEEVSAGLQEDWGYTSGLIFINGNIVNEDDTYVYLSSSWATPILDIDGEEHECWSFAKDCKYDSGTYWPKEARNLLTKKT